MKTKITFAMLSVFLTAAVFAQGKASVYAVNSDISDNLDLRAVASIFGDSRDLADFEYRLNDPNSQISNLDLNNDNQVDYLRVIEMVENNTHLVVLQSVLQQDIYQDVATIAVSKKKNKKVHIQIIGDPYMYGSNYIYEPVYVVRPPLYTSFWVNKYRPYRSYYGWNNYPTFFTYWRPYNYNHYHQNVYAHINHNNYYNYSTTIYNVNANNYYHKYRNNGYEQKYPNRNFAHRTSQTNRYDYDRLQKENGRSPQVTTSARPTSTYRSENKSTMQSTRPTSTSRAIAPNRSTTAPTRTATSIARPTSSTRSVNSSVKPNTTTRSTTSVNRPTSSSTRSNPATSRSTTTSNRAQTTNRSAAQRNSSNTQRPSATSQNAQQRNSNMSTRSPQQNGGSRSSGSSRSLR